MEEQIRKTTAADINEPSVEIASVTIINFRPIGKG